MSNLKIEGRVVKIGQAANVSKNADKPFMKRELWLEIPNGSYPQTVSFEATQDRCDLLDRFVSGDFVTVHFNLYGREWDGRVFNSLNLWKIEADGDAKTSASGGSAGNGANAPQNAGNGATMVGEPPALDGLPF